MERLLIEWVENKNPGFRVRAHARRIHADQGILFGTEGAYAGLVHGNRYSLNSVADVHAAPHRPCPGDESVAALAAAGRATIVRQHLVDYARGVLAGNAGRS
jgi:hypothetical protein